MEGVSVCLSFSYVDNRSSNRRHTCGCIVEDPKKCLVQCEVVWMSGSRKSCSNTGGQAIGPFRTGTFLTGTAIVYSSAEIEKGFSWYATNGSAAYASPQSGIPRIPPAHIIWRQEPFESGKPPSDCHTSFTVSLQPLHNVRSQRRCGLNLQSSVFKNYYISVSWHVLWITVTRISPKLMFTSGQNRTTQYAT